MEIKIGKMDMNTSWEIPWKCWEMMKQNYFLALGLGFLLIAAALLQNIPLIGALISAPLQIILAVGVLFVAKDWENGKASSFKYFLENISKVDRFRPIIPLIIVSTVMSFFSLQVVTTGAGFLVLSTLSVITMAIGFVINLMIAQVTFHPQLTLKRAFENALNAIGANIAPIIVAWIFFWLLAMISALLLFIPLIFAYLPAAISFTYVFYRVLLEGLVLESDPKESEPLL